MRSDDGNRTEAGEVFLWPKRGTSAARLVTDLAELVTRRCSVRSAGRTVSWDSSVMTIRLVLHDSGLRAALFDRLRRAPHVAGRTVSSESPIPLGQPPSVSRRGPLFST